MEAEFITLDLTNSEAEWLRSLLADILILHIQFLLYLYIVIVKQLLLKQRVKITMKKGDTSELDIILLNNC